MTIPTQWYDELISPTIGCIPCSQSCALCSFEKNAQDYSKNSQYEAACNEDGWTGIVLQTDDTAPHEVEGRNKTVLIGSMGDIFTPGVDDSWLDGIFASILHNCLIKKETAHTFLVLTKNDERMADYFAEGAKTLLQRWAQQGEGLLPGETDDETFSDLVNRRTMPSSDPEGQQPTFRWPLPNLSLGVTICDQEEAEQKIPNLLEIPAAQKFICIAPPLSDIDLTRLDFFEQVGSVAWKNALTGEMTIHGAQGQPPQLFTGEKINWVVCAPLEDTDDAEVQRERSVQIEKQCEEAGIPFTLSRLP